MKTAAVLIAAVALPSALLIGGTSGQAAPAETAVEISVDAAAAAVPKPTTKLTKKELQKIVADMRARGITSGELAAREGVIRAANAEIGYREGPNNSQKYSKADGEWCGVFARWVWKKAGVPKLPPPEFGYETAGWATYWGVWGDKHKLLEKLPAKGIGTPLPGDVIVYGKPHTSGHVGIVLRVNANGTLTTADGNIGDMVSRREIKPRSQYTNGQPVYGYVSPAPIKH